MSDGPSMEVTNYPLNSGMSQSLSLQGSGGALPWAGGYPHKEPGLGTQSTMRELQQRQSIHEAACELQRRMAGAAVFPGLSILPDHTREEASACPPGVPLSIDSVDAMEAALELQRRIRGAASFFKPPILVARKREEALTCPPGMTFSIDSEKTRATETITACVGWPSTTAQRNGASSGMESEMRHELIPDDSITELLHWLTPICSHVKNPPRENQLPLHYPTKDYRADQGSYETKTSKEKSATDQKKIAASLREVEVLLETLPLSLQCDGSRQVASTLARIRTHKLYMTWTLRMELVPKSKAGPNNKGGELDSLTLQANRNLQRDGKARSRYRDKMRTTFLDLLEVIKLWVKQTNIPEIDLHRNQGSAQACIEVARACACIEMRFAETLPWAGTPVGPTYTNEGEPQSEDLAGV